MCRLLYNDMQMKKEETKRLCKLASGTGIVLGVGVAYALFIHWTGWGIPCIFHLITGMHCPGCGISRMFLALFRLNFVAAARYNLLVLCLLPFAVVLYAHKAWQYIKYGTVQMGMVEKVFYIVAFLLCIVFFVLRNTNAIPFLRML